jgi:hypothetical protein
MAKVVIPTSSRDLITMLDKRYPDVLDVSEALSPFERGKKAGVIELLRELKQALNKEI